MLYDLHTYTSHYAPLRSQAIRRLGGQLVKKLSWRQQLLQPLQDLGVQSLAKQGISNSSTGFHWPTCRNTPDNILWRIFFTNVTARKALASNGSQVIHRMEWQACLRNYHKSRRHLWMGTDSKRHKLGQVVVHLRLVPASHSLTNDRSCFCSQDDVHFHVGVCKNPEPFQMVFPDVIVFFPLIVFLNES